MSTTETILHLRLFVLFTGLFVGVVFLVNYFPKNREDKPISKYNDKLLSYEEWLEEELKREKE
jgi:uncharacterized ion transporter superfamily protein YfcC